MIASGPDAYEAFLQFLGNPWTLNHWQPHFGHHPDLAEKLALLERIFPPWWCEVTFVAPFRERPGPFKHHLPYHLTTVAGLGGRTRLLTCVTELIRHLETRDAEVPTKVPTGRMRHSSLYPPVLSEFLVGPFLCHIGDVRWQPEGPRHGADYRVDHSAGVLVAEVKRLWTARRQDAVAKDRVSERLRSAPSHQGPLFTTAEAQFNTREDGRRLYPRLRHAAGQLAMSARIAAGKSGRPSAGVPGVVFLDLDGNSLLGNLRDQIERWMTAGWSRSIDLVLLFNHVGWNGAWETVAAPAFSRTGRAWNLLTQSPGACSQGHLHAENRPDGECTLPFL